MAPSCPFSFPMSLPNPAQSCLFMYQHDAETGSRAVVLERPTAFTLAELAPPFEESQFAHHTVFLGGEVSIIMRESASAVHPRSLACLT